MEPAIGFEPLTCALQCVFDLHTLIFAQVPEVPVAGDDVLRSRSNSRFQELVVVWVPAGAHGKSEVWNRRSEWPPYNLYAEAAASFQSVATSVQSPRYDMAAGSQT